MSIAGLLAFAFASAFTGAAFYIAIVEQPARLALDDKAMMAEWTPSDRRGFAMLAVLALFAATAGVAAFGATKDIRWLIGGIVALASWPYVYFLIVPLNNRLLATPAEGGPPEARALLREWGLLEWGLGAIGIAAVAVDLWALS